ncbi:RAMP superfamily CRISPR-associated protein [uncultured Thiodictyon sp.]|jgi:hypothetical protein|uniref:RAMP superfamily CRISPR-associated protein n=1 Tax=uncultured Thiodictyon sp. TaxID=1846217 RepID=UPI0025DBBB5B|nr:RAMP superfamily CRISPR-associated protein [uncultured Thiodictyon sp.]
MTTYRFEVCIGIEGPVLSQAGESREIGIDTAARRSGGRPALPGNLIRGNLRHAWTLFDSLRSNVPDPGADALPWDPNHWLGTASPEHSDNRPVRAHLRFDHDWLAEPPVTSRRARHRIQIEPRTGAVAAGMLQVIDSPFATADQSTFVGHIEADLETQSQADTLAMRIRKGLEYSASLGAMKTAGYGRIKCVAVTATPVEHAAPAPGSVLLLEQTAPRLGLSLCFDRPVCVARPHTGNNRYESEDRIPGSVLRGAIAARIFTGDREQTCADARFAALCAHFSALRITQAIPIEAPADRAALKRPLVPPLSLAEAPDQLDSRKSALYDLALMSGPAGLIHGRAPAFCMDWKYGGVGSRKSAELYGGHSAPRRIEVRTAIRQGRGAAKEGALFASEALVPDGHLWLAEIDLSAIPESARPAVAAALTELVREPLRRVGKTKANAAARLHPPFDPVAASGPLLRDGLACVCLQSAARLLPGPHGLRGTGGEGELFDRYQATWHDLSGGHLKLLRFFAQQQLVGGGYLRERFWKGRAAYNPELLTCSGSVFVLEPVRDQAAAEAVLADWRDHGLGQPQNAPDTDDWWANPYIRQNGYGDVAINLDLHWGLTPSKEAWYVLD